MSQRTNITISGPAASIDVIHCAIIVALPKGDDGKAPTIECKRDRLSGGIAALFMTVTYPEPVVPCEVMAWHNHPTVDTKYRLWKFLRDRATVARCGPRYMLGNTTYTANDDGSITIS